MMIHNDPNVVSAYELCPGDLVLNNAQELFFIVAVSRWGDNRWNVCQVTFMSYTCRLFTLVYYNAQTFYRLINSRTVNAGVK